jgi:hypothetical protein
LRGAAELDACVAAHVPCSGACYLAGDAGAAFSAAIVA